VDYRRQASFDRTYQRLTVSDRTAVEQAIIKLVHALDSGQHSEGLGLKKLQRGFWEIRAGLSIRILFKLEPQTVSFVIVGTHDQIRKSLKHI